MPEVISALGGGEEPQGVGDRRPQFLHGSPACGAQQGFEFRKPQLDRVEVGTVRRQIAEGGTGPFDLFTDALDVMTPQVVHDDEVAWPECGDQHLLEVREKTVAVHRSVQQPWCGQPLDAERADEGAGLPMLMRPVIVDTPPPATAAVAPD